ncbi:MAG: hydroxymethylglutaryl-CoA lyase [Firmicutes bacterium]|nr:hydroxymethylglutaryl-CoA lyase [Bacillota bacterium]
MTLPQRVTLIDVCLRDGLQDESVFVPTQAKLQLLDALARAGVLEAEVTSFVHPKWIPPLADADALAARLPNLPPMRFWALVPNLRGYERSGNAPLFGITTVLSATDAHNQANLNCTSQESLRRLKPVIAAAKADGRSVRAAISVVFGCPFEGEVPLQRVVDLCEQLTAAGADELVLCDTIGVAHPRQVAEVIGQVRARLPEMPLTLHLHDARGFGLANMLAGLQEGITRFDTSLGGFGGCPYAPGAPGNLATERANTFLTAMGIATDIDQAAIEAAAVQAKSAVAAGEPIDTKA